MTQVDGIMAGMKLVAQVKLLPDAEQAAALAATLELANRAANLVSRVAFQRGVYRSYHLRSLVYGDLKALGLSAQPAQQVVRKVADAYQLDRRSMRRFRRNAAQPYDDRCLSWQVEQRTVSIWTVGGRLKGLRFVVGEQQARLLAHRRGESDLLRRDGDWYLHTTCELPEMSQIKPDGFLGVDLGVVNIATTSDGDRYAGRHLNRVRHHNQRLRAKLQRKGTKSAKRLLKRRRRREARFTADVNHGIAKRIVAEAERTGRGIALEDLAGIRGRVRLPRPQRATLHSWAFHQLGQFMAYKAQRVGWWSSRSTRPTHRRLARRAGTSIRPTGRTRPPSAAGRAASLGTPTGTQLATSPSAAWRAGLPSTSHTRARPSLPATLRDLQA